MVQDFLNADFVEAGLVPSDERSIGNVRVRQRRWIENGRIRKEIVFADGVQEHLFEDSVALLRRPDFERLYASVGLSIFDIFGSYLGAPFSRSSPRMIIFSRKEAD